jgi:hypothetical protein
MARRKTQHQEAANELPPELRGDSYEPLGEIADHDFPPVELPASQPREGQPRTFVERQAVITDPHAGMRFHFNYKQHRAEIEFDGKPSPEVRSLLKEGGYRWDGPETKVWAKPIKFAQREQDRVQAKKVFYQAADAIRKERGIDSASQPIPD